MVLARASLPNAFHLPFGGGGASVSVSVSPDNTYRLDSPTATCNGTWVHDMDSEGSDYSHRLHTTQAECCGLCVADARCSAVVWNSPQGTATTTSFWSIYRALLSPSPPRMHRVLYSTSCLHYPGADWCLKSDAVANLGLQGRTRTAAATSSTTTSTSFFGPFITASSQPL